MKKYEIVDCYYHGRSDQGAWSHEPIATTLDRSVADLETRVLNMFEEGRYYVLASNLVSNDALPPTVRHGYVAK